MNAAKIENSPRLQRVAAVLRRHKRALSTMEIIAKAKVCAVSAIVSELRENGMDIRCRRDGEAWWYWVAP